MTSHDQFDLSGKRILLVGSTGMLGRIYATEIAKSGARLAIADLASSDVLALANEIGAHGIEINVVEEDSVVTGVQKAVTALNGLDGAISNAAATGEFLMREGDAFADFENYPLSSWQKTLDVNLTAPLAWIQFCWNAWMKEHGGNIINISSVGAFHTNQILGTYDITKSALLHLTRQLAAELAPGVRVNAVCPGLVKTDFARALWADGRGDEVAQGYPLKRLGEPEDIAQAVLFLASGASSWITGQEIVADGGGEVGFPHG